jgi:hypothetical protein
VALGVFGGLALFYVSARGGSAFGGKRGGAREAGKIIGLGIVGWLVAFALPAVWVEQLSIGSILLLSVILSPLNQMGAFIDSITNYMGLDPAMHIGGLLLEFFAAGAIIGLVYSLILKTKVVRAVLWSAIGLALASFIGPILGNLIGGLFDSLILSYILTFVFICVIIGLCVYGGIYGNLGKTPKNT